MLHAVIEMTPFAHLHQGHADHMSFGSDPMSQTGATWCDQHQWWECSTLQTPRRTLPRLRDPRHGGGP